MPVRAWIALIGVLALARLVIAWALPHGALSIALDEGTYADIVGMMAHGAPVEAYGNGWGASLYPATRAFLLPAGGLASLGLDPFLAVRVVAVVYGALAELAVLALVWLNRDRLAAIDNRGGVRLVSWQSVGLLALLFMPSHAVWGTLGLKDSASEFWAVLAVVLAALLLRAQSVPPRIGWAGGVAVSIAMGFQVRDYIGAAVVVGLLTAVVWRREGRIAVAGWLAVSAVAGGVMGVWAAKPLEPVTLSTQIITPVTSATTPSGPSALAVQQAPPASSGVRGCATIGVEALTGAAECGAVVREKMAENANSGFGAVGGAHASWAGEIFRLPGAAGAVLFRPLWPFDHSAAGSASFWVASLENYLWLGLALLVIGVLAVFRTPVARVVTMAVAYSVVLVGGLALMEGNLGTAFRHKGQLLWAMAVVLALAGDRLRPCATRLVGRRHASVSARQTR